MAAEQPGQVSGGILPKRPVRWLGERGHSLGSLQVHRDKTHSGQGSAWLFKALGVFDHGNIFIKVCGYNALCSSDGQGDFQFR
ncbi:hypothetical protein TNCV_2512511 [Trichonephila clavipes]|nr:hypothetical protein TNCV_2512511 [Trichonephila clavipes]